MTFTSIYSDYPKQCGVCQKITNDSYTSRIDKDKIVHICSIECFKMIVKTNEDNNKKIISRL